METNQLNYYNILEVPETASVEEIKRAYRKLSMMCHPDKNKNNPEATSKFQKLSEAYETLGDADRKKEYDMMRQNPFGHIMQNLFGGMGGMGMGGMGMPHVQVFHNGVPVNVQFQPFAQAIQKPTPIIHQLLVPLNKIFTGTTMPLDIERWIIENGNKVFEKETIYVPIPQGIDEGEIIILRDRGNIISEDCKGDIKIFIKVENNTELKRHGLDLIYEKTITVKEALCGFTFELKYITEKIYTINNHSGNIITHGYQKIIPNMGLTRDGHTGNLIIIFQLKMPNKLTEEVIEKLKNIDF
jgi:DnaJ-class molecular chaperone